MSLLVDAQWLQAHLADPALVVLDATVLLPSPNSTVTIGLPAVMTAGCKRIFSARDTLIC